MTRTRWYSRLMAVALCSGVWLASPACAGARARVYVRVAPPPPRVEAVVVAPGPRYVWVPGFHRWDGRAYVWVAGRYILPPRPAAVWVPGHWVRGSRGWFWVEGRWR